MAVLERPQARGGDHPRLAHPAAEQLPSPPGRRDCLFGPGEYRSNGRAKSLRETGHHRVDRLDNLGRVDPERGRGVEQPRAVEMDRQPELVGGLGGSSDPIDGNRPTAPAVVCVLECQQPCPGLVERLLDVSRADLLGRDDPAVAGVDRSGLDLGVLDDPAELPLVDVAFDPTEQLLSALGVGPDRNLVAHCSGGHEQRRFHSEDRSSPALELVDRWVIVVNIVADGRVAGCRSHLVARQRHRITAEIDHTHSTRHDSKTPAAWILAAGRSGGRQLTLAASQQPTVSWWPTAQSALATASATSRAFAASAGVTLSASTAAVSSSSSTRSTCPSAWWTTSTWRSTYRA